MDHFREAYLENIRMNNYGPSLESAIQEANQLRETNSQLVVALAEAVRQHGPITVPAELIRRVDRRSLQNLYMDYEPRTCNYIVKLNKEGDDT